MRVGILFLFLAVVLPLRAETPDWLQLTPEEFVRRPELDARIDLTVFDRALLSTAIFHETNRVRRRLGLPLLRVLPKADAAADLQANWSAVAGRADHHNPIPGLETSMDRARHAGLNPTRVGENVATTPLYDVGNATEVGIKREGTRNIYINPVTGKTVPVHTYASFAAGVVARWMESPGHRANIVNPVYEYLGCSARPTKGVSGADLFCSVQVFVTLRKPTVEEELEARLGRTH